MAETVYRPSGRLGKLYSPALEAIADCVTPVASSVISTCAPGIAGATLVGYDAVDAATEVLGSGDGREQKQR